MFFAASTSQMLPSCGDGTNKVQGPPVIEDFENDLFEAIQGLVNDGIVENIVASGDAIEVLPGSTPAPILSGGSFRRVIPGTAAPTFAPVVPGGQGRAAGNQDSKDSSEDAPTSYPTWLETDHPTYLVPV